MAKRHPVRNSQFMKAIRDVHAFFQEESFKIKNKQQVLPHTAIMERVCASLKVNPSEVRRTLKEFETSTSPGTPGKKRRTVKKTKRDVDDFCKGRIRQIIYSKYARGESFTLRSILEDIRDNDIGFHGGKDTLRVLLHDIGFKFGKFDSRQQLFEQPHIAASRISFLRSYFENMNLEVPHQVVFLDGTWVYANGSELKMWSDGTSQSVKKRRPTTSTRYIVLHAGTRNGFVSGASLIFVAGIKSGDYHDSNGENFEHWMSTQLLPNLEEPSIIVMDNASYHNVLVEKPPTQSWRKDEIIAWLQEKRIPFAEGLFKAELLNLAIANTSSKKRYKVDDLIEEHGHKVLRLPPYHCHFNPIELVWSQAKRYYNSNIGRNGFGMEAVKKMWEESLEQVTPSMWANYVQHTEKLMMESWESETSIENREPVHPLIINLEDTSEEENDSDDWPVPLE